MRSRSGACGGGRIQDWRAKVAAFTRDERTSGCPTRATIWMRSSYRTSVWNSAWPLPTISRPITQSSSPRAKLLSKASYDPSCSMTVTPADCSRSCVNARGISTGSTACNTPARTRPDAPRVIASSSLRAPSRSASNTAAL
ncbi:hypothetical protein D3C87_1652120 [compost metagenome]